MADDRDGFRTPPTVVDDDDGQQDHPLNQLISDEESSDTYQHNDYTNMLAVRRYLDYEPLDHSEDDDYMK